MNNIDVSQINRVINDAWGSVVATVGDEMQAVIMDPTEFADLGFTDQDIVLTGRLRDSQVVSVSENRAEWSWDPHGTDGYPYAASVYAGFNAYGGPKYVPGRNWPERGIDRTNVPKALAAELHLRGVESRVVERRKIS